MTPDLFDRAERVIQLASRRMTESTSEMRRSQYQLIATNFAGFRESLLDGRLPPIGSGYGFGATRGVDDFGLEDEEMADLVAEAEHLYRTGTLSSSGRPERSPRVSDPRGSPRHLIAIMARRIGRHRLFTRR
jgi:hypothetical protein